MDCEYLIYSGSATCKATLVFTCLFFAIHCNSVLIRLYIIYIKTQSLILLFLLLNSNSWWGEGGKKKIDQKRIISGCIKYILKLFCLLQNHEDYRGLERAKEAMVDVAQYINEVKRDSDTLQIMRDIQVTFVKLVWILNYTFV